MLFPGRAAPYVRETMSTEDRPTSLSQARNATIDALCQGFAEESISLSELERRLETARSARTREELNRLLSDLPGQNVPMRAEARPAVPVEKKPAPARKAERRPTDVVSSSSHLAIAILGGTRRAGRWNPPEDMAAVAIMGGVELDFRDAVLTEGVTELNCFAFMGGVEITVPPGVEVQTHGFALLGGFDQDAELEGQPEAGAPVIRVNGFAFMGGVDIKVAAPGSRKRRDR